MKLIQIFILLGWLLSVAVAHPADMLTQAAYVTISPTQIKIELDLTAGELVAEGFIGKLNPNQDRKIDQQEIQTLSNLVLEQLTLAVNNKPVSLRLESSQIPEVAQIKLGGGQVQLIFFGELNATSQNQFVFKNSYAPVKSAYLANVFVQSKDVKIISQKRDQTQQTFEVGFSVADSALPRVFLWWLGLIPILGVVVWWFSRGQKRRVVQP